MDLEEDQIEALNAVKRGDNCFITGGAGTGKTYLIKMILTYLRSRKSIKSIGVTATTAIAAKLIGGKTIHSLLGLPIGNHEVEKYKKKLMLRKHLIQKWKRVDVLIIDEVSMLSLELFEFIDTIAKYLRKNQNPFGGIQMILVGDFFQLKPVNGELCFKSQIWNKTVDMTTVLKTNHRQVGDKTYSKVCNEFRTNTLTEETLKLLEELSKKKYEGGQSTIKPTRLFCIKHNVEYINNVELKSIEGETKVFKSKDSHSEEICDSRFNIKSRIVLKIGAQVILLKNMTNGLVNGSTGIVKKIYEDSVIVNFFGVGDVEIVYETFESVDENTESIITRRQIPLGLSYALTIHKSQGQSIGLLEIDFDRCFAAGQAYVAISRGTDIKNLYIKNFNRKAIIVDDDVVKFYRSIEKKNKNRKRKLSHYFK